VFRDQSPLYYNPTDHFGQATGVPVLLNTSFILKGELVNTPANVSNTYSTSEMHAPVLGNLLVEKSTD
jgi:carbamoyltransferase